MLCQTFIITLMVEIETNQYDYQSIMNHQQ
jgi:hypothetical protein